LESVVVLEFSQVNVFVFDHHDLPGDSQALGAHIQRGKTTLQGDLAHASRQQGAS